MRTLKTSLRSLSAIAFVTITATTALAKDRPAGDSPSETVPRESTPGTDVTERESAITGDWAADLPRIFDARAELEATDIRFKADYHFGADEWYDHRVVSQITNVDNVWSGWSRSWTIYRIASNGSPGVSLVDSGLIPPLAPGETYTFVRYLPSSVGLDDAYVLMLSAGDADAGNDIAVDVP